MTQDPLWELALCGSWLACDADTSVYLVNRGDVNAGKPAPKKSSSHIFLWCSQGRYQIVENKSSHPPKRDI
ncbi:hypothetical protein DBR46_07125 [Pseudomonas sp. KBW05]|nr:hypothetical protein DBR46_07125 [Pseudomonas sp. KBW05]